MEYPDPYKEVNNLYQSEPIQNLRKRFVEIITRHQVPFAENILKTNDWVNYCYYCTLVRSFVSNPSATIIDWGGLYGHITLMLQTMGYTKVINYLLHPTPHYPLFEEKLEIPTFWGRAPNTLNLDSGSVDVFISSGVLEHVREDGVGREETILQEVHRVLKEGGLFFVWNLPAKLGTSELLAMATGRWHHRYRYWRKDIRRLLRETNFDLLYLDKHKFFPGSMVTFFEKRMDPIRLLKMDNYLSRMVPLNLFARDFALVAKKPENTNKMKRNPK
ncbi:MAG: methyltransferase domain-containing protein [Deltaproteobacteria bacterium]|nr:methyltransferase domain-containing protein [Deltaproteobacteria bacterium]